MKITLRPWHINDAKDLAELANNKNIAQFMADVFPYPYSLENAKTFIAFATSNPNSKIFAIIVDGKPVGSIGLHLQTDILRKNAEIGYWLGEQYWGKGIITQAVPQMIDYGFNNMDIVRIFARIFETNKASQKVVEKCGFILEGKYEKTIFKNNEFIDELIYAVRKKSN
jgi:RimJ/RimL family protein N-acetyltransferase